MEVTVLREPEDVRAACSLFAERVAQEWGIGEATPRSWMESDLAHPDARVFGLRSAGQLIGVATAAPLEHVLTSDQAPQIRAALQARGFCASDIWHWGGHALAAEATGRGLSRLLIEAVALYAMSQSARALVAQTQRGSSGHTLAQRCQFTELARVVDDPVVWLMRELTTGR